MNTPVDVFNGEQILVQLEADPGSGVYAISCLINTDRGIKFTSTVTKELVPFCDNPSAPAWMQAAKDGLTAAVDGAGMTDLSSVPFWFNYYQADVTLNARIKINAAGGVYWQGGLKCSSFDVTGQRKKKAISTVALESDGALSLFLADGTPVAQPYD